MGHKHLSFALLALLALSACGGASGDEPADSATPNAKAVRDSIRAARAAMAKPVNVDTASSGATAPEGSVETAIQRENFGFVGGTRDPFASLINLKATGPTIDNLLLVGVYQSRSGGVDNSVAVLREKDSGKRHMMREGDRLGRLQLVEIATKDATFLIEEFGFERQQTLSLRKQEDVTP